MTALLASSVVAQSPVSPRNAANAERFFTHDNSGSLDCQIETRKPFLDYSFRYEIGYILRCGLAQFGGKETNLEMFLRVTPLHRAAIVLGQSFTVPGIPEHMQGSVNLKHLRTEVQFSGVYAAGEGTYENELAIVDSRGRVYRKKWRSRTDGWALGEVSPMALRPLEVESISLPLWQGVNASGNGLRLTVLLDAAPVSSYSAMLRAWDRAFLLGALSSMLRQLPLASVRLIAFNLDQQRELFRDEDFGAPGISRLATALAEAELGKISYETLQRENGWAELLRRLLQEECERERPADAVVFVGASQRTRAENESKEMAATELAAPLFYLEYSPHPGAEFPDAIERLTKNAHGDVFRLHRPEDLAQALSKMRKVLAAGR